MVTDSSSINASPLNAEPPLTSILVVDDEPDNFDTIDVLLAPYNYQLHYAANGTEAIAHLETNEPDLILLDIMMPQMGGIEACYILKAEPRWQHIPIIIVTALSSKKELARCLEAGADDFICKPVNGLELRARVNSMLRIRKQYQSLVTSLELRTDLANMLVHDLRSPLSAIMLSCGLIQRSELTDQQRRSVERISAAGRQLQFMIDTLLTFAKLDSGKLTLQKEPTNLTELGNEVLKDFEAIADQKHLLLQGFLSEAPALFDVDRPIFRRVLDNLMSNAIKFSPSGSQITLVIQYPQPNQVIIQVMDQGKGISNELKQRIFEKFEIGEATRGIMQTGLGLAFCKMAVTAHSGTLEVSDNYPKGAIFSVSLTSLASAFKSSPCP